MYSSHNNHLLNLPYQETGTNDSEAPFQGKTLMIPISVLANDDESRMTPDLARKMRHSHMTIDSAKASLKDHDETSRIWRRSRVSRYGS